MFLKFTIALLACTWGFSCAQDISGPEEDTNAPAAEEATREVPLPDGKTVPKFEPLDEHRIKIGNVIVNHKERTVSFQAQVNMKEGILEYVCCMPNGKLHESLLVTEADPLHISLGMTLLKFHRFEKFFPVRDENFEWLPFTEPKPEDYADSYVQYVCCMPNGKLHESLLVTEADPLHISLGMTLLKFHRFEKFFPVRDENFEWLPFTEPKPEDYADSYVQIVMTYTENGREQKSDFSDIVVNSQTRKGLNPSDWLYTNSFFYEGAYQASLSGEVISIFASRTSPINYIGDFHDGVNDTGWIVNPQKNLPLGTNVTVTISQKPVQPKQ